MKPLVSYLVLILTFLTNGCEKIEDDFDIMSIISTKWTISSIIDSETNEIVEFPIQLNQFEIYFKLLGIIELPGLCNYSFGKYNLFEDDSIKISNVGQGTKMYCLSKLHMDWENLFIRNLREANSYSIDRNQLIIECNSAYDLVFDFAENFNNTIGQMVFCTNSSIINCPFEIEISLGGISIDTITTGSIYSGDNCDCDDLFGNGALFEITEGSYSYGAREINCFAENKVNSWSGNIIVSQDSCTVVMLDIIP